MKKELKVKTGLKTRKIQVDYLARVEGEGSLFISTKSGKVDCVQLKIFEPPRFFEAFLRGRHYTEAPDITARICGICPVAYQMSAVHAMEQIFNFKTPSVVRNLRRLFYCGEWIESHSLHIFMLHAPDFLGYPDAIQMAKTFPEWVKRGLQIKKAGNEIVRLLGGREIHPVNAKVGGFYKLPSKTDMLPLLESLKQARDETLKTVKWVSTFPFPDYNNDYEFVSLSHSDEYPLNEGRLISNKGLNINISDYDNHFTETHVEYTNALHSTLNARGEYLVGPLARYNLNFDKLPKIVKEAAQDIHFSKVCVNPFHSIIVRSLELLFNFDEAIRIIENYEYENIDMPSSFDLPDERVTVYGCTEAPRGTLYHRYTVNNKGLIEDAQIVPPTSQNQKTIEVDLYKVVEKNLHLSQENLTLLCEQTIRNYDPCISCATHFLKVERKDA
ncbi:MAG: Ni/Fe hydrogenase subunit alpha [Pseudobdellovibrionaceae bacterium]